MIIVVTSSIVVVLRRSFRRELPGGQELPDEPSGRAHGPRSQHLVDHRRQDRPQRTPGCLWVALSNFASAFLVRLLVGAASFAGCDEHSLAFDVDRSGRSHSPSVRSIYLRFCSIFLVKLLSLFEHRFRCKIRSRRAIERSLWTEIGRRKIIRRGIVFEQVEYKVENYKPSRQTMPG